MHASYFHVANTDFNIILPIQEVKKEKKLRVKSALL